MPSKLCLHTEDIFIRRIQNALLHDAVSGWRRRSKTLLDINCANGSFLRHLWHAGFDVTATEASFDLRKQAARRLGQRADIFAAEETDLPFDNKHFDWAILHLTSPRQNNLGKALEEAARVCRHGLAVTFWNTTAPVLLYHNLIYPPIPGYSWFSVRQALQRLHLGTISTYSTLLFAFSLFRKFWPKLFFNSWKTRLPLGAWVTIKVDMSPRSAITPLLLPTSLRKIDHFEPVLEAVSNKTPQNIPRQTKEQTSLR